MSGGKKIYIGERNSERNCTKRPRPKVTTSVDVGIVDPSDSLSSGSLLLWILDHGRCIEPVGCFLRNFQIHITMRGEASWQTSITFTLTRTHAENTRARALLPTSVSYMRSYYDLIVIYRCMISDRKSNRREKFDRVVEVRGPEILQSKKRPRRKKKKKNHGNHRAIDDK